MKYNVTIEDVAVDIDTEIVTRYGTASGAISPPEDDYRSATIEMTIPMPSCVKDLGGMEDGFEVERSVQVDIGKEVVICFTIYGNRRVSGCGGEYERVEC